MDPANRIIEKQHMNQQPDRDYNMQPDMQIMYRAMVEKNREERKKIKEAVQKRLDRIKVEEEIRERWNCFSGEEKADRIEKITSLCEDLVQHHPDYKEFKTVKVHCPVVKDGERLCIIRWNGRRLDETTNWGMVEKEFPEEEIPIMIKRMNDKLRNFTKEEEI